MAVILGTILIGIIVFVFRRRLPPLAAARFKRTVNIAAIAGFLVPFAFMAVGVLLSFASNLTDGFTRPWTALRPVFPALLAAWTSNYSDPVKGDGLAFLLLALFAPLLAAMGMIYAGAVFLLAHGMRSLKRPGHDFNTR